MDERSDALSSDTWRLTPELKDDSALFDGQIVRNLIIYLQLRD
jgi:hypothetical protein